MLRICLCVLLTVLPFKKESAEPFVKPVVMLAEKKVDLKTTLDSTTFKKKIAMRESGDRYHVSNDRGCLGKYQFEKRTLTYLGFTEEDIKVFLTSPHLQEKAMDLLIKEHYRQLKVRGSLEYIGKVIQQDTITLSGLLAASHLLGTAAVNDYLISGGSMREYSKKLKNGRNLKIRKRDAYGTSIKEYLTLN